MVEAIMILICALWIGGYLFTLGAMVSIGDKHELLASHGGSLIWVSLFAWPFTLGMLISFLLQLRNEES